MRFHNNILFVLCMWLYAAPSFAVDSLEVQGLFSGKAVVNIDGKMHILSVGETSPEGVRMISADSKSAVLEVDGKQKRYRLGNKITTSYKKPELVKEQIIANDYGMYLTYGHINGRSVKFLVDTGATTVALSARHAKSLGIPYRIDGAPTHTSTASGIAKAWRVSLKSVSVGRLKQNNVEAVVIDGNHPREILLGMTFLERTKVSKEGGKMIIEQKQ